MFAIDLRALGIFRIALGSVLICDLAIRMQDLSYFYSDSGVLPRHLLLSSFSSQMVGPSIHLASGESWFQALLFILAFTLAGALTIGHHPRMAALGSWLLYNSLGSRNPCVLDGGDLIIKLALFWAILLPTGERYALRSSGIRAAAHSQSPAQTLFSAAAAGLLIQAALVYWITAILKSGEAWKNGTALYYALSIDNMTTPMGKYLLQAHPKLLEALTHATIRFEYIGPFLLFLSFGVPIVRTLVVFAFMLFHVGIAATIQVGLFPYANMMMLLPFLPGRFWDLIGLKNKQAPAHCADSINGLKVQRSPLIVNMIASVSLLYILWWNLGEIRPGMAMSNGMKSIGYTLKLNQRFSMYAPYPSTVDGWFVIVGELSNGKKIDLMRDGQPVIWSKPTDYGAFKNSKHRKYMSRMYGPKSSQGIKIAYCRYLVRKWNLILKKEGAYISKIRMYFASQQTLPEYKKSKIRYKLLYQHTA